MKKDDSDEIWKSLADATRRHLLDLLKDQPWTTGDLCEQFEHLSRFAVMKHLKVLEDAKLVVVRREGRTRWNYINAAPIQQIYDRWMSRHARPLASSMMKLKQQAESRHKEDMKLAKKEKKHG